jgi:hypothetical protein
LIGDRVLGDTPVMSGRERGHGPCGDHGGSCTCRITGRRPAADPITVIGVVGADWAGMPSIRLPERVSAAVAALGLAGQRWLAGLPELVSSLEADWTVTCGTALEGGNAAYVAEAVTADG